MMIDTTFMMLMASLGMVFAVSAPADYACQFAAVFMGLIGGLMVQGWTSEKVKPTPRVMAADIAASVFMGYAAYVAGMPACIACLNEVLPEKLQVTFDPARELGFVIIFSGLAGMAGAGLIRRWWLPRISPESKRDGK